MIDTPRHGPGGGPREETPGPDDDTSQTADEILAAARKRGRGLLDHQKRAAADELSSMAGILRDTAGRFQEHEEDAVAEYVRKAADAVERVSSSLKERGIDEIIRQAEEALRKRPARLLGWTAATGFILGRLLRKGSHPPGEASGH